MVTVTLSSTNHPPSTSTTVLTIVDLDSLAKKGYEIEQFSPLLTITCSAFKWRHNKDNYKHKNKVPYRIFLHGCILILNLKQLYDKTLNDWICKLHVMIDTEIVLLSMIFPQQHIERKVRELLK